MGVPARAARAADSRARARARDYLIPGIFLISETTGRPEEALRGRRGPADKSLSSRDTPANPWLPPSISFPPIFIRQHTFTPLSLGMLSSPRVAPFRCPGVVVLFSSPPDRASAFDRDLFAGPWIASGSYVSVHGAWRRLLGW